MKRVWLLVVMIALASAGELMAKGKYGMQFGGGNTVGAIYFTEQSKFAMGLNLGYSRDNASQKTNRLKTGAFVRKNKAFKENAFIGYGISLAADFGTENGSKIDNRYSIAPYMLIDYHLSDHFLISGGMRFLKYEYEKLGGVRTDTWSSMGTFFSLTVLK